MVDATRIIRITLAMLFEDDIIDGNQYQGIDFDKLVKRVTNTMGDE